MYLSFLAAIGFFKGSRVGVLQRFFKFLSLKKETTDFYKMRKLLF